MFENLSERLERSFKILKGEGKITEINVAETLKDVRRALLDADVNYKVAKQFTDTVKQKALGMNVLTAIKPGQLMVKIVHDELATLMGGEAVELKLQGRPSIILMSGLQVRVRQPSRVSWPTCSSRNSTRSLCSLRATCIVLPPSNSYM